MVRVETQKSGPNEKGKNVVLRTQADLLSYKFVVFLLHVYILELKDGTEDTLNSTYDVSHW